MKKVLVNIFLLIFCLCLVGCDGVAFQPVVCLHRDLDCDKICDKCGDEVSYSDILTDMYKVEVTGSTDSLIEEIPGVIQAGSKVEIKVYPTTDITLHVFINGKEIKMSHYGSDYWGYEFKMPKENIIIHLTYDQFYDKVDYTFSDLYYWVDNTENVDKIAIYNKDYTYQKFSEIYYTTKPTDITRMLDILKQPLEKYDSRELDISEDENIKPIEFNTTIIYYVGDQYYELNFINNMLYWNDFSTSQIFRFKDKTYLVPNALLDYELKAYKFEYDGLSSDIKKISDNSFFERYYHINSIEFIEHNGGIPGVNPTYYVDSRYGQIDLISTNIFKLNDKYYKIVSGIDYWAYNNCKLLKTECTYMWAYSPLGHTKVMLCDCCESLSIENPHEDSNYDLLCDTCSYVISEIDINGTYIPNTIAYINHSINDFNEVTIINHTLYLSSQINDNIRIGKFEYCSMANKTLGEIINIDELYFENDNFKEIVKELFLKQSFYTIATVAIPELASSYILMELEEELYYIYMQTNIDGLSSIVIYELKKEKNSNN